MEKKLENVFQVHKIMAVKKYFSYFNKITLN